MKVTQIAFGIEKNWSHKHRDARLIPWHVCLISLICGIYCGDQMGVAVGAILNILFVVLILSMMGLLFVVSKRTDGMPAKRDCRFWLVLWWMLWFVFGFFHGMLLCLF